MSEKVMLVDISKCTACRGCQVACKQWNELPPVATHNAGSYQNPPDLNPYTYTLIRFQEIEDSQGTLRWIFRNDRCFHCTEPVCQRTCPVPGCIFKTPEGAVVIDPNKCIGCKYCVYTCPFEIPRFDEITGKVYKCTLCYERLAEGLTPACVKACPTGTLTFGNRKGMIAQAYNRAAALGGNANVYGDKFVGGTHVIYVLDDLPSLYAKLPQEPTIDTSVVFWKDILKPLSLLSFWGTVAATFLYYVAKGPKVPALKGDDTHE